MTTLPPINGTQLPQLRLADNCLDLDQGFINNLQSMMSNYARALVAQIDSFIKTRETQEYTCRGGWNYWQCLPNVQYRKDGNDYAIRSIGQNGLQEKFSVSQANDSSNPSRIRWHIDGLLQGDIVLDSNGIQILNQGPTPVSKLRKLAFDEKAQPQRVHQILLQEARALIAMAQAGHKEVPFSDKTYHIDRQDKDDTTHYSLQLDDDLLSVTCSRDETIQHIKREGANGTKYRLELVPQAEGKPIDESAELYFVNQHKIDGDQSLSETFAQAETAEAEYEREGIYRFLVGQERERLIAQHRDKLFEPGNLATIQSGTGILYNKPHSRHTGQDMVSRLYQSRIIPRGYLSLALASGAQARDLTNIDGTKCKLAQFGNARLRAEILQTNRANYLDNLGKFRKYLEAIGCHFTDEDTDRRIMLWLLLQNQDALKSVGIFLRPVQNAHGKTVLTVYIVDLAEAATWKKLPLTIIKNHKEDSIKLMSFPPSYRSGSEKKPPLNCPADLARMFTEIGCRVASPLEVEEFIRWQQPDSEVKQYIQDRIDGCTNIKAAGTYSAHLVTQLLKADLEKSHHTNIQEIYPDSRETEGRNHSPFIKYTNNDGSSHIGWIKIGKANAEKTERKLRELHELAGKHQANPVIIDVTALDINQRAINRSLEYEIEAA